MATTRTSIQVVKTNASIVTTKIMEEQFKEGAKARGNIKRSSVPENCGRGHAKPPMTTAAISRCTCDPDTFGSCEGCKDAF
jgi:hypothetical protein